MIQSLNDAADGFVHMVRTERNMRIHFFFGFLVLVAATLFGINRAEWMILCASIALVFVTEMINTVIEDTLDAVEPRLTHPVRRIKHAAAAAVLVSALNALIIGFLVFSTYWSTPFERMIRVRYASWHVTFITLLMVIFLTVAGKAFFGRGPGHPAGHGTPFRGGAVSGHAAVAFALWTVVLFSQTNAFIVMVTLLLALLVAQSRLRAKIHSLIEVLAGAAIGFLVATLFFQVFKP